MLLLEIVLCHPAMLSSFSLLCFSPGSDTGAKLLSLPWSACLHDPYKGP